jgi:hypothetical protein
MAPALRPGIVLRPRADIFPFRRLDHLDPPG